MPVAWKLEPGVLVVTLMGDYPFEELKAAVAEALRSPELQPETPMLLDARGSLKYPSTDALRSLGEWLASLRPQGISARLALVTSRERLHLAERGALHFCEHGVETVIFTSLAEAVAWLRPAGESRPTP
jgi:hypothetical protein